ncbi:dynamin-related protein 3A isoform X2 [Cryptomeria japonica]|uniref:dynamin-related protein 3A isoform X2 n=1 Tax=Cryptomeria japonica TaxID=3369 RepID=UPI0025AC6199|nr:dynamin-related protein 3A isoform X2 [Cryptomeria japonica]
MAEQQEMLMSLGQAVIPVVNRLQDIFAQLGSASTIDLPQVAVVGSQSSGKSSVLEALVGRDFLPRGSDICTRRPLVLQLVQIAAPRKDKDNEDALAHEWGEFLHLPGKRFFDFATIRSEIQAETEREVGINKGVSDKQIRLKIYSPHVLNITLVDLPGITRVPVGDQPSDIEARIRTMILSYIRHETCIILAVSPANSDLANSDALQMARMADPDGSRTIGVITKLDIMDRGTDARNFLLGNVIPLRLGYIGIVNRSQEDIIANRSIRDALVYEESFFRSRPVYHSLADRCGVPQLAKKLNQILVHHIRAILPELKARINVQMVSVVNELSTYGEIVDSKDGQGTLLLSILTKYTDAFTSIVDGKNEDMSTAELSGGARLHYIFQSIFVKSLEEVDPCEDLTDEDIRTAIQNATGAKNALFVPEIPFEVLVRKQIARLLDPSLQCARFIYDELVKIAHHCGTVDLQRFPVLQKHIEEVVGGFLRKGLRPAETMVGHIIEMEMDYINTSHPAFIGGSKAVEAALQQHRSSKETSDSDRVPGSEKIQKSRALLPKSNTSRAASDQTVTRPVAHHEKPVAPGNASGGSWGISSIFGTSESRAPTKENSVNKTYNDPVRSIDPMFSKIQLKEPPAILRLTEAQTDDELVEITVTKLLVRSYYNIVRKNIQDAVPKAIMHFLVQKTKRELHSVFILKLYSEKNFEDLLQEKEDIAIKRKRCKDILRVLEQAARTLDELPLDSDVPSKNSSSTVDATGLPRAQGFQPSMFAIASDEYGVFGPQSSNIPYLGTTKNAKSRKSSNSGEQPSFVPLKHFG